MSQASFEEKLLEKVQGGEELDISWWRSCSNVLQLRLRKDGGREDEITVKDRF